MSGSKRENDRIINGLAALAHGTVGWTALRDAGISRGTIARRIASGALTEVLPRSYLVGHHGFTAERAWWIAVHAVGRDGRLSGRTACEALGWLQPRPSRITVVGGPHIRSDVLIAQWPDGTHAVRVQISRMASLPDTILRTDTGLPTLPVANLLVGVAAQGTDRQLRAAIRSAEFCGMTDDERARRALRRGRKGSTRLRDQLDRRMIGEARLRNEVEEAALELFASFGLPTPLTNVDVPFDGPVMNADFFFAELGLVIEADEPHHDTAESRVRDRAYDSAIRARGLDLIRFGREQLLGDHDQHARIHADLVGAGYLPPPEAGLDWEPRRNELRPKYPFTLEEMRAGGLLANRW